MQLARIIGFLNKFSWSIFSIRSDTTFSQMGNCISLLPQIATLIDGHGGIRQIDAPTVAVEIMFDEPGYIITPALLIRQTHRVAAMKANDVLFPGKIYLLVPASRANSRVSDVEMELVDYACQKSMGSKRGRCSSDGFKCLPISSVENRTGITCDTESNSCQWRPVLEPIFEESGSFRVTCELANGLCSN